MPFIKLSTSVKLDEEKKAALGAMFSENIQIIEGKTAEVTMVECIDGTAMWKGGERRNCVFIDVKMFGACPEDQKQKLTEVFLAKVSEITGADLINIFMNIYESDTWGSRGAYRVIAKTT